MLAGELVDEDKVHLAITNYPASDGVGLTLIHKEFPSAVAAQEYFEKVLAKALKVTERGEKKDTAGKVVGKRATAVVPTGKPDEPFPAILLTYALNPAGNSICGKAATKSPRKVLRSPPRAHHF